MLTKTLLKWYFDINENIIKMIFWNVKQNESEIFLTIQMLQVIKNPEREKNKIFVLNFCWMKCRCSKQSHPPVRIHLSTLGPLSPSNQHTFLVS
jgi:hypothetical protein